MRRGFFAWAGDVEELDRHGSLWDELAVRTRQPDPFCCSPCWQLSYHEAFAPEQRLLIRQSDDSLVTFAERRTRRGIVLTPIESMWCFGCNVLGRDGLDLLRDTLIDIEKHYFPAFPRIAISAMTARGAFLGELRRRFAAEFEFFRVSRDVQCAASLAGGLDGFLSRRSANHRRKMVKSSRRAAERGITFERRRPASISEGRAVYGRMIAVEQASWKGIDDSGMTGTGPKEFYAAMLRRLTASQEARIIFARHEERDIGFIFGGMAGDIYRGQQFSFDKDWSDTSIGNLMQLEQIRWLCEEGARRYDMGPLLGERMEYKRHWTEKNFHIETWMLQKS